MRPPAKPPRWFLIWRLWPRCSSRWRGFTATLEHYRDAFAGGSFAAYFENSVLLAAISTLAALAIGVPAAYGLARFEWPRQWDHRIGDWILSTRMLPPIVTIVPLFLMLR